MAEICHHKIRQRKRQRFIFKTMVIPYDEFPLIGRSHSRMAPRLTGFLGVELRAPLLATRINVVNFYLIV